MKILVMNSGSSSIKFRLFAMPEGLCLARGLVECIGDDQSGIRYSVPDRGIELRQKLSLANHAEGLKWISTILTDAEHGVLQSPDELTAVGHRVVHGGEAFHEAIVVTEDVLAAIRECVPLAPLHNPANLQGLELCHELFGQAPSIAVFDTAFHQSIPEFIYRYAIPTELYREHGIRRYGFHGTSHAYVASRAAEHLGKPLEECNLITVHLGNGASVAAIRAGKSWDTSMGLTPLEGLIMGTRCGDLDPGIVLFLARQLSMEVEDIDRLLNKKSGLEGLCGDNDMRDVERRCELEDPRAQLALAMYAYRVRKYIGAYAVALGAVDAIVFTAGIGENSSLVRELCCENLGIMGFVLDAQANAARVEHVKAIHSADSRGALLVIRTNEELEIARQSYQVLSKKAL